MKNLLCSDNAFALFTSIFCGILIFCGIFFSCHKSEQTYKINLIDDPNFPNYLFVPVTINDTSVSFLFDTGSTFTMIDFLIADKIGIKAVGYKPFPFTIGMENKQISDSIAYAKGSLTIGNLHFLGDIVLSGKKLAEIFPYDVTLLGMNTIKKINWLFNFSDSMVTISKDKIEIPALPDDKILTLDFNSGYDSAISSITINGRSFQNVLFDTGYDATFYVDENKLDVDIIFTESDFKAYSSSPKHFFIWMYAGDKRFIRTDSIQINDFTIKGMNVAYLNKEYKNTVITANFVRRFRMMYIDSKNKKIQFYVSPSDSVRYQRKDIQDFIREMSPHVQGNDTIKVDISKFNL